MQAMRHHHSDPADEDDFLEPPSKSSRKREMQALQDLGEQLVALSPERLKKVPLPETLYEAILRRPRASRWRRAAASCSTSAS